MKRALRAATILGLTATFWSCAKSDAPAPNSATGCAEFVSIPVTAHSLGAADIAAANKLFSSSGIDNRTFRYVRYERSPFETYYPPYTTYDEQVVGIQEYANGLPIFTAVSNFVFWNGRFHGRIGQSTAGTSLTASPGLTLVEVRNLFFASMEQFDRAANADSDQCVTAEFGYYDLGAGTSNAPENLVKAWKVTRKDAQYPFAYYEDNGGKLIYYDNGIRTFR
ncbi:hypothetical protein [Hymenobacter sp.]|uniref:hypothetical protein n=1 Tax=Hymenobacter sp. TaxID=1898978 RepID=UPI00286D1371|nr:hypothetical protein [Hymenobacter sp.]